MEGVGREGEGKHGFEVSVDLSIDTRGVRILQPQRAISDVHNVITELKSVDESKKQTRYSAYGQYPAHGHEGGGTATTGVGWVEMVGWWCRNTQTQTDGGIEYGIEAR